MADWRKFRAMNTTTGMWWTILGPGPDGLYYGWVDGQVDMTPLPGDVPSWVNLTTFVGH